MGPITLSIHRTEKHLWILSGLTVGRAMSRQNCRSFWISSLSFYIFLLACPERILQYRESGILLLTLSSFSLLINTVTTSQGLPSKAKEEGVRSQCLHQGCGIEEITYLRRCFYIFCIFKINMVFQQR